MSRYLIVSMLALSLAIGLSACSDTWSGVKQDTGDNMSATGKALEKSGDKVKN